jgi:AraC family transcriptional regulator
MMNAQAHGADNFSADGAPGSSIKRAWHGIVAELRSHAAGELPAFSSTYTEVAMLIRGQCIVTRPGDGRYQQTMATRGAIWLRPAGPDEDFVVQYQAISEVLHVYLPANPFSVLEKGQEFHGASTAQLRHHVGIHDLLIGQIADCVLMEMRQETSAGGILIESLATTLAARLLQCYSNVSDKRSEWRSTRNRLADRKLQQVLDFIEAHIEDDITVEQLASLACLSQSHFAREFKAATGQSPYRHVTERRLVHAKALLSESHRSLVDIAYACGFSSQGNFGRAFRDATGDTPGRYRALRTVAPQQSYAPTIYASASPLVGAAAEPSRPGSATSAQTTARFANDTDAQHGENADALLLSVHPPLEKENYR